MLCDIISRDRHIIYLVCYTSIPTAWPGLVTSTYYALQYMAYNYVYVRQYAVVMLHMIHYMCLLTHAWHMSVIAQPLWLCTWCTVALGLVVIGRLYLVYSPYSWTITYSVHMHCVCTCIHTMSCDSSIALTYMLLAQAGPSNSLFM